MPPISLQSYEKEKRSKLFFVNWKDELIITIFADLFSAI